MTCNCWMVLPERPRPCRWGPYQSSGHYWTPTFLLHCSLKDKSWAKEKNHINTKASLRCHLKIQIKLCIIIFCVCLDANRKMCVNSDVSRLLFSTQSSLKATLTIHFHFVRVTWDEIHSAIKRWEGVLLLWIWEKATVLSDVSCPSVKAEKAIGTRWGQ
jgi:hypothetical protein